MHEPNFQLPAGFLWQYDFIVWLQAFHSPIFDTIAMVLSLLGSEPFYFFALPIVLWVFSRKYGLRLAYVFLFSMFCNAWLKALFHVQRPIGVPGIESRFVGSAPGFSMPSGHAQGPMTFWTLIGKMRKRRSIIWLASLLVVLIGLSRVYLGLHWPLDVLVGWFVGYIIASVGWLLTEWWIYRNIPLRVSLFFAIAMPLCLLAFHHSASGVEYAIFLLTMGVGALAERAWVQSVMDSAWWKRICAGVIGIAGLIALQWMTKAYADAWTGKVLCDGAIGIWATLVAPWLFVQCGLYHQEGGRAAA